MKRNWEREQARRFWNWPLPGRGRLRSRVLCDASWYFGHFVDRIVPC